MSTPIVEPAPAEACPCCGRYQGTGLAQSPALLAVCDVLVVRALEVVGKRIVRMPGAGRSRFKEMRGRPWHVAHTIWQADGDIAERALAGAWDVVPAMLTSHGCCGVTARQVTTMLDSYARDLLVTGTPHSLTELRYRFQDRLGIEVPEPEPYIPSAEVQAIVAPPAPRPAAPLGPASPRSARHRG